MTLPDLSTNRDAVLEPAEDAAAAPLKPDGLDDDEWALVREHRARKAEEERRAAAWAPIFAQLNEAAATDGTDDWHSAARLFVARADRRPRRKLRLGRRDSRLRRGPHADGGFVETTICGHGRVWALAQFAAGGLGEKLRGPPP
jgi:hypothetical protein